MSNKKEKLEALIKKRETLIEEYKRYAIFLSGLQDQISDIDGDIRMLENEQEKEDT